MTAELSIFEARDKESHRGTVRSEMMWINDGDSHKGLRLAVWGPALGYITLSDATLKGTHGTATAHWVEDEHGGEPVHIAEFPEFVVPAAADWSAPDTTASALGASMLTTVVRGQVHREGVATLHIGLAVTGSDEFLPWEIQLRLKA